MPQCSRRSLRSLSLTAGASARTISDDQHRVRLDDLRHGCSLPAADTLRGRVVLIVAQAQLPAVLSAIQLDGIARRILLCPPDLAPTHLPAIVAEAEVDAIVTDGTGPSLEGCAGVPVIRCRSEIAEAPGAPGDCGVETEWVLFTSGTTGRPKLVRHTLPSLSGPLDDGLAVPSGAVWSTFYDVRRYGGLQILLRALLGGGSMVLSNAGEAVADFLARAGAEGVTHISGTPSHWRRALMSPAAGRMSPAYVRLSGEVADQGILDRLHQAYPNASVAHAFASTEAGVAFDVRDGLAGFPVSYLEGPGGRAEGPSGKAEMRVEDGTLRIRSARTAEGYLGQPDRELRGADAFVDTGDMVERRGDRYYFIGRKEGVINVGGQKVFPEEVEAVINRHPDVRMSRVSPRRSPITGAIVAADIVLRTEAEGAEPAFARVREQIVQACRDWLPPHKVPVSLRRVASLEIAASGKLVRRA